MQKGGPITNAYAAANGYVWADYFSGDIADVIWWAHRICTCGCRWLRLGRFLFWEVLPMQQGGPIVYAYVAADGYVWADYFSGDVANAIGWAHRICPCGCP